MIKGKRLNLSLIYIFCFFRMFLIFIPVVVPFFLSHGLKMKDIFFLQATFGFTVALFEIPSGYLCDYFGRKKTLNLGSLISGVAFTWLYFANSLYDFFFFEILVGLGMSFISGADFSLLYDSFPHHPRAALLKAKAVAQIYFSLGVAEAIASILGGLLVLLSFNAVIVGQLIAGWIPFFISLLLIEAERESPDGTHLENFKRIMYQIFLKDKQTRLIFINQVIWGLSSFIAVWIFQKFWLDGNIPLYAFGLIWASYNLMVAFAGKFVLIYRLKVGDRGVLRTLGVLPILAYLGLAFFGGWWGVLIGLLFKLSRAINQVFLKSELNSKFDSEFRATLNSTVSLFFRFGFFILGPLVGLSIDTLGLRNTFLILGVSYFFVAIVILRPLISTYRPKA